MKRFLSHRPTRNFDLKGLIAWRDEPRTTTQITIIAPRFAPNSDLTVYLAVVLCPPSERKFTHGRQEKKNQISFARSHTHTRNFLRNYPHPIPEDNS